MKNFVYCQNDQFRSAEYGTIALERKSKYGFICVCTPFDFVSLVAFDSANDYARLVDNANPDEVGYEDLHQLEKLNVGESFSSDGDNVWTRLW